MPRRHPALTTLQAAAAGTGNGIVLDTRQVNQMFVEISGTFVGTVTFEASVDGTNFFAIGLKTAADGAAVTSATAPGQWKMIADTVIASFRARVSAFTSGTITVKALAVLNG